ncbi:hypothetical protein B484DRAFT_457645 [Ochromonadaceae sp. CCMP2298]|nr:hypothetical protein B484DRAFT_457645 [Ochromonadaceae sp. CCMP2298]|eukprot:CAMPEP_0173183792 /NCGR_PEP_ID=MMETSP1141-20130122/8593_1 /TAXON_ID=483371 /ORGANISM="non described non described, Strain CCMP2298" /LENGTH=509 /DNA_ID=CAMNT_0014107043 /DNA_START=67 /DNA_END=1596 /DNA_ORIENTATION=+
MGSAASALEASSKGELARQLQASLSQYQGEGLDDEQMLLKLEAEYNKIIGNLRSKEPLKAKSPTSPAKKSTDSSSKPAAEKASPKNGLSRGLSQTVVKASAKMVRGNTRRRSFDGTGKVVMNKSESEDLAKAVAASVQIAADLTQQQAELEKKQEQQDSWDSVTQQPFCDVCQMAFKSTAFLNRHVQYSDLHIKNVSKRDNKDTPLPEPVDGNSAKFMQKQVEGKHYKLLYTGGKLFWRNQVNITIDMYLHIFPQVLELISFDSVKHQETGRLYLNIVTLQDLLQKVISSEVEAEMKEQKSKLTPGTPVADAAELKANAAELREKIMFNLVTTFVLKRLQQDPSCSKNSVIYVQLSGDQHSTPLLAEKPLVLVPVTMSRRRRTSTEEIDATIESIKEHHTEAAAHNDKAHAHAHSSKQHHVGSSKNTVSSKELSDSTMDMALRVSELVYSMVKYMRMKKWYADLPLPKVRFIKAVRMVIRQSLVAATKERLAKSPTPARRSKAVRSKEV